MIDLPYIALAADRIRPHLRRTPLFAALHTQRVPWARGPVHLKLENLQVTGSFKARGAVNHALSLTPAERARGLVTASGGNHGLGVAYAGRITGAPVTVFLPANSPLVKQQRLEALGARVVRHGAVWDDANVAAIALAAREGLAYLHPFADPAIIAGQATIGLEILADLPEVGVVVAAIGGGGLISGVSLALKLSRPAITVIGVEPVGAPTLHQSRQEGRVIELSEIATAANTLAPRRSDPRNFEIIERHVDNIVLVSDDEMREAARWLWSECGIAAELSGAAAAAALLQGRIPAAAHGPACAIVCGAGTDGIG